MLQSDSLIHVLRPLLIRGECARDASQRYVKRDGYCCDLRKDCHDIGSPLPPEHQTASWSVEGVTWGVSDMLDASTYFRRTA